MKIDFKKTFSRLIFFCNICCILVLLASNAAPWLNPYKWWPVALAGMIFPLLIILVLLFLILWLPFKPRYSIYSLIAILISIPNILSTFGSSFSSKFNQSKEKDALRVLTWNTGLMNYTAPDSNTAIQNNATIFKKLKDADADVLCLQEFFTAVVPGHYLNFIEHITEELNYPYHYFSYDIPRFNGNFYSGSIIFSRYPIADSQKINYPIDRSRSLSIVGSVLRTGIIVSNDTVDILTTRLQSVFFRRREYQELGNIKSGGDSALTGLKHIIYKLRLGYKERTEQVEIVKQLIDKSTRPLVFTGDLNDVPVSNTYFELKDNLKDAWVKKSFGLGRTFVRISPTLRIDHIFYNKQLAVRQVKRIFSEGTSDHHALVADFLLK